MSSVPRDHDSSRHVFSVDTLQAVPVGPAPLTDPSPSDATISRAGSQKSAVVGTLQSALLPMPQQFGRYRVVRSLGSGGFGSVYLADDPDLNRKVAIKVPQQERLSNPVVRAAFLREARLAAQFQHAGLVSVFDVHADSDPVFIVLEYLSGPSLADLWVDPKLTSVRAVELLIAVAEAIHYAHLRGLIHRDLKPANIIMNADGQPVVTDFGLAIEEREYATLTVGYEGTPKYMAPEQVRGETHRLDARTDVWAIGVMLYSALTGRMPFEASQVTGLFEQILMSDPPLPRQIDGSLSRGLQRICQRCLSKRMSDRFSTAQDLADELRAWLDASGSASHSSAAQSAVDAARAAGSAAPSVTGVSRGQSRSTETTHSQSTENGLRVVPRGLRSFDEADADFFLRLLPGPCDREGLPASLRQWKSQIETREADRGFSVGLLYGPSGCGKSSFVRAGLFPRLDPRVQTVFVETTGTDTEQHLQRALQRQFPQAHGESLPETFFRLRRGRGLPDNGKLLIVFDQFEQWLHTNSPDPEHKLVQALRQCDGERLQVLLLVRDDFGMAAVRFLQALEVPLTEGRNYATIDLFDLQHARRVLTLFGRAHDRLPSGELSHEQSRFLDQAVAGLSEQGRVVPIRLALFSEMMRSKPWTASSLRKIGGAEGVGVSFLEECFGAGPRSASGGGSTAMNPRYRLLRNAASSVLQALLPEPGSPLKGRFRTESELRELAGLTNQPEQLAEVLRVLDGELRLITPIDMAEVASSGETSGARSAAGSNRTTSNNAEWTGTRGRDATGHDNVKHGSTGQPLQPVEPLQPNGQTADKDKEPRSAGGTERLASNRSYQLTHDYLVPALRVWFDRQQQATVRGRTRLLLERRAAIWSDTHEARNLPSWLEWVRIWLLVPASDQTETQRAMLATATRIHLRRSVLVMLASLGLTLAALQVEATRQAVLDEQRLDSQIEQMLVADVSLVRKLIDALPADTSRWAPRLRELVRDPKTRKSDRWHAQLALAGVDESAAMALADGIADDEPDRIRVTVERLKPWSSALTPKLWAAYESSSSSRQLRLASVLAQLDSDSLRWSEIAEPASRGLVAENSMIVRHWLTLLKPVRKHLLNPLERRFREETLSESERLQAAHVLEEWSGGDLDRLIPLTLIATPRLHAALLPTLVALRDEAVRRLRTVHDQTLVVGVEADSEEAVRRKGMALVSLIRLQDSGDTWSALQAAPDPRLRTWLIDRLPKYGISRADIWQEHGRQTDASVRQALLLMLDAIWPESASDEKDLIAQLTSLAESASDPGERAAAEWVLKHHKAAPPRELTVIDGSELPGDSTRWVRNSQGHVLVRIDPGEFLMGSPLTEVGREKSESQHLQKIPRPFWMSDCEVTITEFKRFRTDIDFSGSVSPQRDCPMNMTEWYHAIAYCRWLSEKEGIPEEQMVYPPLSEIKPGLMLPAGNLARTGYRLPTEPEWEFAARAGTTTARHFGETIDFANDYVCFARDTLTPVGTFRPSSFGLFDLLGNVGEWCHSNDCAYPVGPAATVAPPADQPVSEGIHRVARGSAHRSLTRTVRSAQRFSFAPDARLSTLGFRLVRTGPVTP